MSHVLVAGAGPVGLTAALACAQRGHQVTVLEAGDGLAAESRASTFHPPSLEILDRLGVLPELEALGLRAHTFAYRDRRSGQAAVFNLGLLRGDTPFPYRLQCEQSKLTPILLRHLLNHPGCTVRFGFRVNSVDSFAAQQVSVSTVDGQRADGDWLIAADGAHSSVRQSLRVEFEGITYPERFLVASTDEDLPAMLPGLAYVNYVFDPAEWAVFLRTPDHWRVLLPTPEGTDDQHEVTRMPHRLRAIADPGRPWRVAHASLYRVHQRVADTFKVGNVLLAGDAAHVNNPLGGLGMNSGLHDAAAYACALDSEAQQVAAQRRRVALEFVRRVSHANWERLHDPEAHLAQMMATAADPERARAYLLTSSMIAQEPAHD